MKTMQMSSLVVISLVCILKYLEQKSSEADFLLSACLAFFFFFLLFSPVLCEQSKKKKTPHQGLYFISFLKFLLHSGSNRVGEYTRVRVNVLKAGAETANTFSHGISCCQRGRKNNSMNVSQRGNYAEADIYKEKLKSRCDCGSSTQ